MSDYYYIPDYVHIAIEGETIVFVNLRADQYSMILGAQARIFKSFISRTPDSIARVVHVPDAASPGDGAQQADLLRDLLQNGVLSAVGTNHAEPIASFIPLPQENLLEPRSLHSVRTTLRDLFVLLLSCAIAKWRLSRTSIERIVLAVHTQKRSRNVIDPLDLNEARRLVCVYNKLRPLVPHSYLCLFDSLSLLEFLARNNCYPNWVFAVQLEPWAAHCWVQYEDIAFNEDVEKTHAYLPLMSV